MLPFSYCNSTRLLFGRESELLVAKHLKALGVTKLLIVFGGGSAKRSGLLDRVIDSCKKEGLSVFEKGGVRPNPMIEFCRDGIELVRQNGIDGLLAVGGGSVIDTAKTIAAGVNYQGDVWDFFCGKALPQNVLPVGTVLTIPAAGSEQSIRAVLSNGNVKTGFGNELVRPRVSAINPELFFTLSKTQIAAGVFDMMSHIFERYFTNTTAVDFTTQEAEAALRVIMQNGLKVIENPKDFDAWSAVGLAGSFAHNGFFGLGHVEDWACHAMEHALSGWRESIVHGVGLAILTPAWMRYVWSANPERFKRFAVHVMGIADSGDTETVIQLGIARLCGFIEKMGLPHALSEIVSETVPVAELATLAAGKTPIGNFMKLDAKNVQAIYEAVL